MKFYTLILALTVVCCNKNDSSGDKQQYELLTNKKWQIRSNISIDSMQRETDLYSQQEEYRKDDYLLFNPDSTYELNDNLVLERGSTSRILDSGHWILSENNTQLLRSSDTYVRDYEPATIKELTANKLVIQSDFPSDRSSIITEYSVIP